MMHIIHPKLPTNKVRYNIYEKIKKPKIIIYKISHFPELRYELWVTTFAAFQHIYKGKFTKKYKFIALMIF